MLAHEAAPEVSRLHAHFLHTPASVARYAAMMLDIPWSCSAHARDIWTTPVWEKTEKLKTANWLVTCTAHGQQYLNALADRPDAVELVYHGLDLGRFPPPDFSSAKGDGSSEKDPVVILSVGRAVEKKGYGTLLGALARLPDDLHWRFVHIGGGPLRGRLQRHARALGIAEGSTLWYDLEGFDASNTDCRESALSFLSGWTQKLHRLGYVSGVYSSASSGIKALDDARIERPDRFVLPDAIWIARWDGKANTDTTYIRDDGWRPGGRMKQYRGGHDETWGGVRINIDSNFLDLGRGTTARAEKDRCGGTRINWQDYPLLRPPRTKKNGQEVVPDPALVTTLQCLLREKKYFDGDLTGEYGTRTLKATRAWQADHKMPEKNLWSRQHWMSLLSAGSKPILKYGSSGDAVRRLQRALNAASPKATLVVTGVYGPGVEPAVKDWQDRVGMEPSGAVNKRVWRKLLKGVRT